ncbi:MAG TPA: sulfur carrier protein ThiS [Acidimicrobiales bacterium]|nr:sulfur carrier protein ThiS [Acidimicrobiales bacterium]
MTGPDASVLVNGRAEALAPGATVGSLVAAHVASPRGVAVAVNEEVVPRSAWPTTRLAAGDRVEILTAAQGG